MGKRSNFKRRKGDFYETFDPRAVKALVPFLPYGVRYAEVCAGNLALVINIASERPDALCTFMSDIEPRQPGIACRDACTGFLDGDLDYVDVIITNPPWTRALLHQMITSLVATGKDVWLLFDTDWLFTAQARPYLRYCEKIVAIGRCKWIRNTDNDPKDNVAWYLFKSKPATPTPQFYGRK